jgi:hypothetical protein
MEFLHFQKVEVVFHLKKVEVIFYLKKIKVVFYSKINEVVFNFQIAEVVFHLKKIIFHLVGLNQCCHISSSLVKIRLHTENHLPGLPASALQVCAGGVGWRGGGGGWRLKLGCDKKSLST